MKFWFLKKSTEKQEDVTACEIFWKKWMLIWYLVKLKKKYHDNFLFENCLFKVQYSISFY